MDDGERLEFYLARQQMHQELADSASSQIESEDHLTLVEHYRRRIEALRAQETNNLAS